MKKIQNPVFWLFIFTCLAPLLDRPVVAQEALSVRITVNSDRDETIPDTFLTLREAIEIVNGTLPQDKLSAAEKALIQPLKALETPRIEFNLPSQQTTIRLNSILPPLIRPVVLDGTTQLGYTKSSNPKNPLSIPVVVITPSANVEIFRGLTIAANNVIIRGLSLYSFTAKPNSTLSTPPADIFIADSQTVSETSQEQHLYLTNKTSSLIPQKVTIEDNWLGTPPSKRNIEATIMQSNNRLPRSAFGVSVFNSLGTTIQNNLIINHDGSGIITGKQATNLRIISNIITHNGLAGMPDAIRLEGNIQNTEVISNLIQDNAGSGIFLFKPSGAVQILDNAIANNGKRFNRAAIYLMGNDHQVINNQIDRQNGSGVVVAAYPQSRNNKINNNQFSNLSGLAIDLVAQLNVSPQDYQQGDGANPLTDSYQRQRKTGNFGIDAPRFLSPEFFIINAAKGVTLDGVAEPGSQVEIYRSSQVASTRDLIGKPIATAKVNKKGRFSVTLRMLKPGERVSAIVTHPQYGTSEPAVNTVIRSIE